jgi:cytochrome c biogenesis protein CcmG, thiol:disulfide interchange protein DsbE
MSDFRLCHPSAGMARLLLPLVCACLLAACGSSGPDKSAGPSRAELQRALAGSPAPLASLHTQANRLVGGGTSAFKARLRTLRGHPVVVNKWASWCGPCRGEFPYFQHLGVRLGKRVGFVGVDANDNAPAARRFLHDFPVTYPSYSDPNLKVSAVFNAVQAFPTTAFYDPGGRLSYVHQGAYPSERKLGQDIDRYAR